jgi:hypothetical protein
MGGHLRFPPPTKKTFFPKATTEPIVIGVGFNGFGRLEIVGQGSKGGLCIFLDYVTRQTSSATCGPISSPGVIAVDSIVWETPQKRARALTELSGFMQPSVASVNAVARIRKGHRVRSKASSGIVAVPSADLLARLHQSTPFGFFVADFRGCLTDKVRLHALDASGLQLGTTLANLHFPSRFRPFDPCTPGSSTVGFGVAGSARAALAP